MKKIEVFCLNPSCISAMRSTVALAARLTQRNHEIKSMEDVLRLYREPSSDDFIKALCKLPHPTLQKFAVINFVVFGASRRFLAQVTRHQNEVKFMSGSLQYSDHSTCDDNINNFTVPYSLIEADAECRGNAQYQSNYHTAQYINSCTAAMNDYSRARAQGIDNDTCGYIAPQGLRNVLLISATPFQWKHMISQRVCHRNTPETRYVFLRIWEVLYDMCPEIFGTAVGPFCMQGPCKEGKLNCGKPIDINKVATPTEIIEAEFPLLVKEQTNA